MNAFSDPLSSELKLKNWTFEGRKKIVKNHSSYALSCCLKHFLYNTLIAIFNFCHKDVLLRKKSEYKFHVMQHFPTINTSMFTCSPCQSNLGHHPHRKRFAYQNKIYLIFFWETWPEFALLELDLAECHFCIGPKSWGRKAAKFQRLFVTKSNPTGEVIHNVNPSSRLKLATYVFRSMELFLEDWNGRAWGGGP